jgi:hypothetical protein
MNGNLNEFSVYKDYLNFSSNSNYQTGAAFGFHDSPVYSDVLAMGKKENTMQSVVTRFLLTSTLLTQIVQGSSVLMTLFPLALKHLIILKHAKG